MMTYFFNVQYSNFLNNYSSYLSQLEFDQNLPLKEQTISSTAQSYLGGASGTWFDYFMEQTKSQVKNMLIFCEEAKIRDIKLDDKDRENIKEQIAALKTAAEAAAANGYTYNSYLNMTFGSGVKEKDIKKAFEFSTLASKCQAEIEKELLALVTDERILAERDANEKKFQITDYSYYLITVNYDDVVKEIAGTDEDNIKQKADEILAEYTKQIVEARSFVESLTEKATVEDFKNAVNEYAANKNYSTEFDKADFKGDKPSDENLAIIKTKLVESVLAEINDEKTETKSELVTEGEGDGAKYTLYDIELTVTAAEVFDDIREAVFNALTSAKSSYFLEKQTYTEDDEYSEWLFDAERKDGDKTKFFSGDEIVDDKAVKSDGYSYARAYFLENRPYLDKTVTKNVAYMLFDTSETAAKAIEEFKAGTIDLDTFLKIAEENEALAADKFENYQKSNADSDELDKWIFDDERKIGDYSSEAIALSESEYMVLYYYDNGEEAWYVTIKNNLFSDDFAAHFKTLENEYTVIMNDKNLQKIKEI